MKIQIGKKTVAPTDIMAWRTSMVVNDMSYQLFITRSTLRLVETHGVFQNINVPVSNFCKKCCIFGELFVM